MAKRPTRDAEGREGSARRRGRYPSWERGIVRGGKERWTGGPPVACVWWRPKAEQAGAVGADHVTGAPPPFCPAEAVFRAQCSGRRALPPGRSSAQPPLPSLPLPATGLRPVSLLPPAPSSPPPFCSRALPAEDRRRGGASRLPPPFRAPAPSGASPRPGPRSHVLRLQPRVRLLLRRDGRLGCHGLQR